MIGKGGEPSLPYPFQYVFDVHRLSGPMFRYRYKFSCLAAIVVM